MCTRQICSGLDQTLEHPTHLRNAGPSSLKIDDLTELTAHETRLLPRAHSGHQSYHNGLIWTMCCAGDAKERCLGHHGSQRPRHVAAFQ